MSCDRVQNRLEANVGSSGGESRQRRDRGERRSSRTVEEVQKLYELLKTQSFDDYDAAADNDDDSDAYKKRLVETIAILQSCIIYFDENNQYGFALKQILPFGNYMWLKGNERNDGPVDVQTLVDILREQTRRLRENKKVRVVDFYTCVDIHLPDDCSKADLQREEEFNLMVRNRVPEVQNFTEKMLRLKRMEYKARGGKYKSISLYKKLMSGTEPLKKYWIHSSILKTGLENGWRVTKVHNVLTFTAQRICEDYIQFNQDMRLKHMSQGQGFMGLFHKLMNNGFYGWFCRAVETYQETQLLFSGLDSYDHFQNQANGMCSGMVLQEQAILVVQNPHDSQDEKTMKITRLFDKQIAKAKKAIQGHVDFIQNCTKEKVLQSRREKITTLKRYVNDTIVGKSDALANFELHNQIRDKIKDQKRTDCESNNKRFYEIPKSRRPVNKNALKTREEAMSKALYGRQNQNTSIVLFDQECLKSVCFGLVTSPRRRTLMKLKNDVAVSVLAFAKHRIANFTRKLNDCLASRLCSVSIRLVMSDTDSAAYQIRYPLFLKRDKTTKELLFRDETTKQKVLANLGADVFKGHIELFLSGAKEMSRIVDRAHFTKDKIYFDGSRKKQVGLYTDEKPLPAVIVCFQASAPKCYYFRTTNVDKEAKMGEGVTSDNAKHKGIPRKTNVSESDYSRLLLRWDRQYDAERSIMGLQPHDRREIFREVKYVHVDQVIQSKKNLALPTPKTKKVLKVTNLIPIDAKVFSSYSMYTSQAGVFLTKTQKRLGVAPSDKVIFPRSHFGSHSVASRFCQMVRKFNETKTYDEMFTDAHLDELNKREINYLDNEMERFYSNGVRAERLVRLDEQLDLQVCVEYLLRQYHDLDVNNSKASKQARSHREDLREEAAYRGMNANATEHSPPSGNSLVTMIAHYRATNFTSTVGVMGGEWHNIEPTKLMDVLIYAFVEHELIPPIEESYASSLGNFFSILMSDPMQQVFARHVNILYRRGWRKQNLAQKACYVFVEHYVGLVLMIVQQALLQNNCTLSTTPSFASDVSRFTPMTKLQAVLRTFLLAFDPISYLLEEVSNSEVHERKFEFHFRQYTKYVSEILQSYEKWLEESVDAYGIGTMMPRRELFIRVVGAGGYEQSRSNFLNGIASVATNNDDDVVSTSTTSTSTSTEDLDLNRIDIVIKNTDSAVSQIDASSINKPAITIINSDDDVTAAASSTTVVVDAANPNVQSLTNEQILNAVSEAVKTELKLVVQRVVVPERNKNASSSTKSYVAYATSNSNSGDLPESIITNYDVDSSDSASQINNNNDDDDDENDLSTVDYNAPNQLIMNQIKIKYKQKHNS